VQELTLHLRFYTLGYDPRFELPANGNDGTNNRGVAGLVYQSANESLIDLDLLHRKVTKVFEGRVPGSEIVERQFKPHSAQRLQLLMDFGSGFYKYALRQLEPETRGVGTGFTKGSLYPGNQARAPQLNAREVYRNARHLDTLRRPSENLPHRLPHDPIAQRNNEARRLSERDKNVWSLPTESRMVPSNERLGSNNVACIKIDYWLIVKFKLFFSDSSL
jgi:hypothetical protein